MDDEDGGAEWDDSESDAEEEETSLSLEAPPQQRPLQQQDHSRVIVHVDLNAFYYQCEALLDPSLRGKPVGVQQVRGGMVDRRQQGGTPRHKRASEATTNEHTHITSQPTRQKYLLVTSSYEARARGVSKMMSLVEGRRRCPELLVVNGEVSASSSLLFSSAMHQIGWADGTTVCVFSLSG